MFVNTDIKERKKKKKNERKISLFTMTEAILEK
jgi:hypothetical protein